MKPNQVVAEMFAYLALPHLSPSLLHMVKPGNGNGNENGNGNNLLCGTYCSISVLIIPAPWLHIGRYRPHTFLIVDGTWHDGRRNELTGNDISNMQKTKPIIETRSLNT